MARLILGVTGSVAAIKTPELLAALRAAGHDVRIVATGPALYFFRPEEVDPPWDGEGLPPSARSSATRTSGPRPATAGAIPSCISSCASGPTC